MEGELHSVLAVLYGTTGGVNYWIVSIQYRSSKQDIYQENGVWFS